MKKSKWKKWIIGTVIALFVISLIPIRQTIKDGGSVGYSALLYDYIDYHGMNGEGVENGRSVEYIKVGKELYILGYLVYENTHIETIDGPDLLESDAQKPDAQPQTPDGQPQTPDDDGPTESTLLTGTSGTTPQTSAMDEKMRAAYADFAYKLFAMCAKEDDNSLVSPFSVYTALAMLANGAEGETAEQIRVLLGLTESERNAYMAAWIAALTGQSDIAFTCADSLWVQDRYQKKVKKTFLDACSDSFKAEVFAAAMNDGTVKDINAWVEKHTKGMIKEIFEPGDIDSDVLMVLINAITFDAKWAISFPTESVEQNALFNGEDGKHKIVEMMHGDADSVYLENDYVYGCTKAYTGGKFRYVALLPKEGMSLDEAIASLNGTTVDALFAGAIYGDEVSIALPKYECAYSKELKDALRALGMEDAFTARADFSNMFPTEPSYVDRVIHKTYMSLDSAGTKAAAVTAVTNRKLSAAIGKRSIRFDRPFIYMIVDENNLPLFIGTYE